MKGILIQKQYQENTQIAKEEAQKLGRELVSTNQSIEERIVHNTQVIINSEAYQKISNGQARNDTLIAALQTNLKILGFDLGDTGILGDGVDGDLGRKTRQAVTEFQKEYVNSKKRSETSVRTSRSGSLPEFLIHNR